VFLEQVFGNDGAQESIAQKLKAFIGFLVTLEVLAHERGVRERQLVKMQVVWCHPRDLGDGIDKRFIFVKEFIDCAKDRSDRAQHYSLNYLNITAELWQPNPKVLLRAIFTSRSCAS